jgi:hypothetical protein
MHWSAKGVCLPDDEPKSSNCGNGHVASKVSFVVDAWTTEPVCFARTKGHVEMHESNVGASRASGFMIDVDSGEPPIKYIMNHQQIYDRFSWSIA